MDLIPLLSRILIIVGTLLLVTLSITHFYSKRNNSGSPNNPDKINIREYYRKILNSYEIDNKKKNNNRNLKKENHLHAEKDERSEQNNKSAGG